VPLQLGGAEDVPGDEGDVGGDGRVVVHQPVEELEAAAVGEPEVDEGAVDHVLGEALLRAADARRLVNRRAAAAEPGGDGAAQRGFVVDVEDGGHGNA
jgi:hypothetical protein